MEPRSRVDSLMNIQPPNRNEFLSYTCNGTRRVCENQLLSATVFLAFYDHIWHDDQHINRHIVQKISQ
ncbi:Hypothetical predicted protein [Octopus vulgaris]|uniref:Uncharacterized protein n=1 Tax=Octopus vulgaris TaxID=6645 RepID=A0AA36BI14_OCTVU|nr:Hypothetical predicted protein [Octopus vulgaris]